MRANSMYICRAILKHGHSSFSLVILEYYEVEDLLKREKDYIDLFNSEYNIVKDPSKNPMSGHKHSEESIKNISYAAKKIEHSGRFKTEEMSGENNHMFGKNHSDETLKKLSDAKTGSKHSDETRKKLSGANKGENHPMLGQARPEAAGRPSKSIEVFDNKTNETINF
jgi:group I intron endonuclease